MSHRAMFTAITAAALLHILFPVQAECEATAPETRTPAYYFFLKGIVERSNGNIDKALKDLLEANYLSPDSSAIITELAITSTKANDADAAQRWSSKALSIDPSNIEAKMILAQVLEYKGELKRVLKLLEEVSAQEPDYEEALYRAASLYSRMGEYDKAISAYSKIVNAGSHRAFLAAYYLGRLYLKKQNFSKAEEAFKNSIHLYPTLPSVYTELAKCYRLQGKTDEALKLFREIIAKGGAGIETRIEMTDLLISAGRMKEAGQELEAILASRYDIKALLQLAISYLKEEKSDKAIFVLEKIRNRWPDQEQTTFLTALAYEQNGEIDKASELLSEINPNGPLGPDASVRFALLEEKRGNDNKALTILKKVLIKHPDNKDAAFIFASILEKQGQTAEAAKLLEETSRFYPEDLELMMRIAMLLDSAGERKRAINIAQAILEKDPDHVPALNFVGYLYAEQGIRLDKAEELITRALSFRHDDGYIIDSMGWICFKKRLYDLAVRYLERAHELVPDDPVIISHLGEALTAVGRYEKAIKLLKHGLLLAEDEKTRNTIEKQIKKAEKKLWDLVDN